MFDTLKQKWGIRSNLQVVLILLVFTLAGLSITQVRKPVFGVFGLDDDTALWIKTVVYLLSIFPLYQIFLLAYGTLFGQFRFFWEKEKAMARWAARRFRN